MNSSNRNRISEYEEKSLSTPTRKENAKRPVSRNQSPTTEATRQTSSTASSLYIGGRQTTPPPPTTPDPGTGKLI